MQNKEQAILKLEKYNQKHILNNLEAAENIEQEELVNQILKIDFEKMFKIYNNYNHKNNTIVASEITPIPFIDKEKIDVKEKEHYKEIGERTNKKRAICNNYNGRSVKGLDLDLMVQKELLN